MNIDVFILFLHVLLLISILYNYVYHECVIYRCLTDDVYKHVTAMDNIIVLLWTKNVLINEVTNVKLKSYRAT